MTPTAAIQQVREALKHSPTKACFLEALKAFAIIEASLALMDLCHVCNKPLSEIGGDFCSVGHATLVPTSGTVRLSGVTYLNREVIEAMLAPSKDADHPRPVIDGGHRPISGDIKTAGNPPNQGRGVKRPATNGDKVVAPELKSLARTLHEAKENFVNIPGMKYTQPWPDKLPGDFGYIPQPWVDMAFAQAKAVIIAAAPKPYDEVK